MAGKGSAEGGFLARGWGVSSKAGTRGVSEGIRGGGWGGCTGGVEFEVFVEVGVAEVALCGCLSVRSTERG